MERVVLLDTHVLLWLVGDQRRLSHPAVCALKDWLELAVTNLELEVIPISPAIAARSTRIAQNFHGDPADQLIAATAIELDVPLITADQSLRASPAVRTIW